MYTIASVNYYWEMLTYTYAVLPYKEVVLKWNNLVHLLIADFWSNQCRFDFLSFYFRLKLTSIARISFWFSFYWSFCSFISNIFLHSRKKDRLIRGSSRTEVHQYSVIAATSPTLTYMGRGREGRFEHFLLILSGRGS